MTPTDKQFNVALEASAGTGKTFQLSMRVAAMLINGIDPRDILCLTFTNKAANEMLERILKILDLAAKGILPDNERLVLEGSISEKSPNGKNISEQLQQLAVKAQNNLLSNYSALKVKTIDAFSNQILKIFPFEAGLRPDYQIFSGDTEELKEDAFYGIMNKLITKHEWQQVLTKFSYAFEIIPVNMGNTLKNYASFSSEHYLSLKHLMDAPINPHDIELMLDRTLILKKDVINNVKLLLQDIDCSTLNIKQTSTFNSLKSITNIKDIAKNKFFRQKPNEHGYFKKYDFKSSVFDIHDKITSMISEYLLLMGKIAVSLSLSLGKFLNDELKALKNNQNAFTFNDINEKVYEILVSDNTHIDKDYLYFRLDGKINHILIDEFQDTSYRQWLILKPLAEEAMSGVGQYDKNGSFFCVGDPKQNLYRFRGSSSLLFKAVAEAYEGKLFKKTLLTNYRSDRNIIEFVNELFTYIAENNTNKNLDIFQLNQQPRQNCGEGYVFVTTYNKLSQDEQGGFVNFATEQVKNAVKNGWKYKHIAILVPTNKAGLEIKIQLHSQNIPVRLETSNKLVDTGIFQTVIALAEFMETGSDFSFLKYTFTENSVMDGNDYAKGFKQQAVTDKINECIKDVQKTIFERLIEVIKLTGTQERFKNEPDFQLTMDVIAQNAANEKNIAVFLDTVKKAAEDVSSITAEHSNAVTVMTIHKSKGLQFPMVILPQLNFDMEVNAKNSSFILSDSGYNQAHISFIHNKDNICYLNEEEINAIREENDLCFLDSLNKLYVAITRAENAVIIGLENSNTSGNIKNSEQLLIQTLSKTKGLPYSKGNPNAPIIKEKLDTVRHSPVKIPPIPLGEKKLIDTNEDKSVDFNAVIFGTIFHKSAFLLNGFTDKDINKAINEALAVSGALITKAASAEIKYYLKKLAESKEWQSLFKGTTFRERKLAKDGGLYSIDFYSVFDDNIVLIDYKTGEITPSQKEKYTEQVKKYENILAEIYNLPIKSYLYHFYKNELEIIAL